MEWLGPPAPYHNAGRGLSGEVAGRSVQVTWFEHNTEIALDAETNTKVGSVGPAIPKSSRPSTAGTRV